MNIVRAEDFDDILVIGAELQRRGLDRAHFHIVDLTQATSMGADGRTVFRFTLREADVPVARPGHVLVVHPGAQTSEQPLSKFIEGA